MHDSQDKPKRHCWECLRRTLVCDFTWPTCNRCARSGVECPGYNETRPLRVKQFALKKAKSRGKKRTDREDRKLTDVNEKPTISILEPELKTDVHAMLDAVRYYNDYIYPLMARKREAGHNWNIYQITQEQFQKGVTRPEYARIGLVCMVLSHRRSQARSDSDAKALQRTALKYRGQALLSLNGAIKERSKQNQSVLLAGILTLLHVDQLQQGFTSDCKIHLEGARIIITACGGMSSLVESPGLMPLILDFVYLVVMADTSSPASQLLVGSLSIHELEYMILKYGGIGYAFRMCPPPLLVEILKINNLRMRSSKQRIRHNILEGEAVALLRRLDVFSGEKWVAADDSIDKGITLVASMYQAAVILYCMSSLQDLDVLQTSPILQKNRRTARDLVYELISRTRAAFGIAGCLVWPLMVLGVEAGDDDCTAMREFIRRGLAEQWIYSATYAPMALKETLERYWALGKSGWEACFDRPSIFSALIAVNCGGIPF
ncbi:C6 zinc finger domain-containing protein [Aspergillus heterothallicus]